MLKVIPRAGYPEHSTWHHPITAFGGGTMIILMGGFLALVLGQNAYAANICDITQDEIESVTAHYDWDDEDPTFQSQIVAPFDCRKFGDLCILTGATAAEDIVCDYWDDAVAHTDEVTLKANISSAISTAQDAWGDQEPSYSSSEECSRRKKVVFDSTDEHKQKTRAFKTWVLFFGEIGGSSKGWYKSGGNWTKDLSGDVEIRVFPSSEYWTGTGNYYDTCTYPQWQANDDDGFVNVKVSWAGLFSGVELPERVDNTGTYHFTGGFLWSCAWQIASWDDARCPP